ncbi:S-adenosyl-L-methionine-dependent methyltransferase [Lentithecium fluviatile CBS 122367]|uniref:DNA (cytosine-5-)-methyltransferase n=1 Tax=Lentithecium fluviatile CBS 122367 TaxID=1168545 RepID=A0A6G1JCX6_9PLEO|nr:S-adenosyl-L-methionine-dependent methyltransferase [Lentithecium fluviatile CBS 122367]
MSAWNYGSPQQRSRLILSITAPGLEPLAPPSHTHSHPAGHRVRSIGDLLNGQKFGLQDDGITPFPFVSAGRATAHLPDIGNGSVRGCIEYPDHRLTRPLNYNDRTIIKCIPTNPPGQGLAEAAAMGLVPYGLYAERKEIGKAYRRINKDGLFSTVVTAPSPHDARGGAVVHWSQDRPISIEEAREIQGIPSNEVIIGSTAEQVKMVGNAVDRRVSEQLGLELRRAVEKSPPDILNADKFWDLARICNLGTDRRKSLICVRIPKPASSTPKKPLQWTVGTSFISSDFSTGSEQVDNNLESAASDPDSLRSVNPVNATNRAPATPRLSEQRQSSPAEDESDSSGEDETIPETESESSSSSEELGSNAPTGGLLPSIKAAVPNGSRSFAQGVDYLRPSFSPFSSLTVHDKRSREESEELEQGSVASGSSSPSKRMRRTPSWNPLVALPSEVRPVKALRVPIASADWIVVLPDKGAEFRESTILRSSGHDRPKTLQQTPTDEGFVNSRMSTGPHRSGELQQTPAFTPPTELSSSVTFHAQPSRTTSMARRTRLSGLPADFGPQSWNKVPEKEIKKAKEVARRGSRPYA